MGTDDHHTIPASDLRRSVEDAEEIEKKKRERNAVGSFYALITP